MFIFCLNLRITIPVLFRARLQHILNTSILRFSVRVVDIGEYNVEISGALVEIMMPHFHAEHEGAFVDGADVVGQRIIGIARRC